MFQFFGHCNVVHNHHICRTYTRQSVADKDLHLLEVNPDGKYEIKDSEICGNPVKVVEMNGFRVVDTAKKDGELYHVYKRKEKEAVELKFVPYYTWANRGENEMMVWVRV